jgi:hypothetical protein
MRNNKNEFRINFVNGNIDPWKNIIYYGIPEKINGEYVVNTKRKTSKYLINIAKELGIFRFIIEKKDDLLQPALVWQPTE